MSSLSSCRVCTICLMKYTVRAFMVPTLSLLVAAGVAISDDEVGIVTILSCKSVCAEGFVVLCGLVGPIISSRYISVRYSTINHHDDVIKWKHFPCYWPFVWGIHRGPVNSPHKGQWRGALMFFFYLRLNKRSGKQWWGWWLSCPLWRHRNDSSGLLHKWSNPTEYVHSWSVSSDKISPQREKRVKMSLGLLHIYRIWVIVPLLGFKTHRYIIPDSILQIHNSSYRKTRQNLHLGR